MAQILKKLGVLLDRKQKGTMAGLMVLMVLGAFLQTAGVGMLVQVVSVEEERAYDMLKKLQINPNDKLKSMSKGTKEKVQLILIMSRRAKLYVLDEPIAGVDPAARDYILETILSNYDEDAAILISTHLISDIENILDQVIFIKNGQIALNTSVDNIREKEGKSDRKSVV